MHIDQQIIAKQIEYRELMMNFHILILLAVAAFALCENSELSEHKVLQPTVLKNPEDVKAK